MSSEKVKILDESWKEPVKKLLKLRDTHSGMKKDTIDFDSIWNDEYINKYFDPNEPYFLWGYIEDDKLLSICGVYKWKLIPRCTSTIFISDFSVGIRLFAIAEDIWKVHFKWMLDNGITQGFTFSDAGSFVGGSRLNLYPFLRSIDNIENGVILPNNRTFSWNQDMTALPTIWSGGTWHYIYFQVYDATWDNSTKTYSFDNFRNIAWTNNTSYTNGSGTYLGGSGQANNATNVANVLASTAGYNTARTPNYAGTSESINLTMSNSGSRLDGTMTNTTGSDILLYKYTMSNSTGFPAGSNNRLMSLAWADSSNAFTNSHTVNSTGCFNTFRRTHYGYPTWLRLQFYFTPAGSGTEADIGYFNYVFEDAVSQADALQFIKTQTEAFFHDPLDTGEDYPYLRATVNADSIDFHYYRQGILRVVPTYYRFGYNQGGSGGTAYPSTADSALQAHSNYNFATTKSNELNTFAKGNGNIKAQTLNMSLADYYDGRGNLTLGSG